MLQLSRETRKKAEGSTDEGNSIRNNTLIYYIRPSWRSMTTRQERYPMPSHAAPRCFCQHHAHAIRHRPRHITSPSTAYHTLRRKTCQAADSPRTSCGEEENPIAITPSDIRKKDIREQETETVVQSFAQQILHIVRHCALI